MHPLQFRKLLERAGLSQSEAARQLEISDRTMRRYVSGETRVPRAVVYAILHVINKRKDDTIQSIPGTR